MGTGSAQKPAIDPCHSLEAWGSALSDEDRQTTTSRGRQIMSARCQQQAGWQAWWANDKGGVDSDKQVGNHEEGRKGAGQD